MTIPDRRSDKVLDSLRGYTRRQPWVKEDVLVLQSLFDALDYAHDTVRAREAEIDEMQRAYSKDRQSLIRRIDYLEYRVKEEQNKGMWAYLKMLISPCH